MLTVITVLPELAKALARAGLILGICPGLILGVANTLQAQTQQVAPVATPSAASALTTAGLVTIESDVQKADNALGVITATGNVRIVYPDQRVVATARQAQYFVQEGRIVLSGDVDVIQPDGHALRAAKVTVLVNSQRVIAEPVPGQQVVSTLRLNTPAVPR